MDRVARIKDRNEKLKNSKLPWMKSWQLISEYVRSRKSNFTTSHTPGQFLTGKIFDSTGPVSVHQAASSMLGALWPNGGKTFIFEAPDEMDAETKESADVKEWLFKATQKAISVIDHPKAGFMLSQEEYMADQLAFGTSGIYVEEREYDDSMPVVFKAIDTKVMSIAEGVDGFVDTVYQETRMTVRQVVQKYGKGNCSKTMQDMFDKGNQEEHVTILHAVEPRIDNPAGFGAEGMPIASIHIDTHTNHILLESGFQEMPIFVTRFWKTMDEVYGRSPAFEAMSDILEINYKRETTIVAEEKILNPPLGFYDYGNGGNVKLGAGEVTVVPMNGRTQTTNGKMFEQLVTIGDIKPTYQRIVELKKDIQENFFIDKLTDLNNDSRMTLGEAQMRNELRGQSLGTIYTRQMHELYNRVIERVFNILYKRGLLGCPPDSPQAHEEGALVIPPAIYALVQQGKEAYKVTYVSPAARILRSEELRGIQQTTQYAVEVAATKPDVLDNLDTDWGLRQVQDLTGAPSPLCLPFEKVEEIRKNRAAAQKEQNDQMMSHLQSQIAELLGKAAHEGSKAGLPLQALMPQPQGQ